MKRARMRRAASIKIDIDPSAEGDQSRKHSKNDDSLHLEGYIDEEETSQRRSTKYIKDNIMI